MIRPLGNKILVRLKSREEISKGGIHIPEQYQNAENWGVITSAGPKVREDLKVDDIVYIKPTQGTHYKAQGHDFIVIESPKVICKLIDEKDDA